jgi:hypothetical protein
MKIRTKALLAAGFAISGAALSAAPVGAVTRFEDQAQADLSFTYKGRAITCTVTGTSSSQLEDATFEGHHLTTMVARTAVTDSDRSCAAAARQSVAGMSWRARDDTGGASQATAPTSEVDYGFTVVGSAPYTVTATHLVRFECDESVGGCSVELTTSPK